LNIDYGKWKRNLLQHTIYRYLSNKLEKIIAVGKCYLKGKNGKFR
jgi:hypothetical protein